MATDSTQVIHFQSPSTKDLMGSRFDYSAMMPPEPLTYQGRFVVTCLRSPRSGIRLYVLVYDLHGWPMRVIQHRGWFKDQVIYARPATDREMAETHMRHYCIAADHWEGIVEREQAYGVDANEARLICTGSPYIAGSDDDARLNLLRERRAKEREEQQFPLLARAGLIQLMYQRKGA